MSPGVCSSNAMAEFREFINYSALLDPPLKGEGISPSIGVEMKRCVPRLDRFLVSADWEEQFPNMGQKR